MITCKEATYNGECVREIWHPGQHRGAHRTLCEEEHGDDDSCSLRVGHDGSHYDYLTEAVWGAAEPSCGDDAGGKKVLGCTSPEGHSGPHEDAFGGQWITSAADDTEMVTSETGGTKGKKKAQLGAVEPGALLAVARVAGMGSDKYDRGNFLKGYDWSLSFDALQRHALAFWSGENIDPESGECHMAHVAWHALALTAFHGHELGTDDRWQQ